MGKIHYFPEDSIHHVWDNSLEPVLQVDPGETVFFETREATNNQITPESTVDVIETLDWDSFYPLAGPLYVNGAEPGDALVIEFLDIQHRGWGWSAILPDFGVLPDVFDRPYLRIWETPDGEYAFMDDYIRVPLEPFAGTIGVAPAASGEHAPMPPRHVGGNMDTRHIVRGSTLYLPVEVEGALFSIGDGHLAQGDGEVCVTAIEGPLGIACRFDLIKGLHLPSPEFETMPGSLTPKGDEKGYFAAMGIDDDLYEATRKATRHMVERLTQMYNIGPEDAYVLVSVAGDLKISEVVDPNWVVTAYMPKAVFLTEPKMFAKEGRRR